MKHCVFDMQYFLEEVVGLQGMINYVDARTSWMDDIVKQAQWQGITQASTKHYHSMECKPPTAAVATQENTSMLLANTKKADISVSNNHFSPLNRRWW